MDFDTKKNEFLAEISYQHDLPLREQRYLIHKDADPRVLDDVDTMIKAMEVSVTYATYATTAVKDNKEFRLNYLALNYPPLAHLPHNYIEPEYKEFNNSLLTLWSKLPNEEYQSAAKELLTETLEHQKEPVQELEDENVNSKLDLLMATPRVAFFMEN